MVNICPATRQACETGDVCRMLWCAKWGPGHKPMNERFLSKAERYALHMAEQRRDRDQR